MRRKKMNTTTPAWIIISLFALNAMVRAQFAAQATITSMYDDNVNNNYLPISDRVTEAALNLAHDWTSESSNAQIFYMGAINYYSAITERTYHSHSMGATYSKLFDDDGKTLLNLGGTFGLRVGRDDYTFYDNNIISVYANVKHTFTEQVVGKAGYSFRSVRFPELPDFNYAEHNGSVQATFFLPTSTTIILETDIGTKIYSTPNDDSTLSSASQGQGMGRRMLSASSPAVTQVAGIARVGQAVMDGTGLSVTASYQWNVQKESRYLTSDYGTISDDEIFDDHYGYEGTQSSVMLTQLFPSNIHMNIIGAIQNRKYIDRPAYDAGDNIIAGAREDTRTVVTLQMKKKIETFGMVIGLSYDYITNRSNDFFYDYTNNAFTARISYTY